MIESMHADIFCPGPSVCQTIAGDDGDEMKSISWPIMAICIISAGLHSPAKGGSPPAQNVETSSEIVPPKPERMLQNGFKEISTPDRKLYSLIAKIAQSRGAALSEYDRVEFYESGDQFWVELFVNPFRRAWSLPLKLPPDVYIRISKQNLGVMEILECEGIC